MEEKHRRIVGLKAENFKKITLVEVTPHPHMNVIGGKNAAGKSSLIDAISAALGGGKWCPPKAVREGADKSVVLLDLEDIEVRWAKTATGAPTVTVQNKEGMRFTSPQSVLDRLTSRLGFDPSMFLRMSPVDQKQQMLDALGITVADLETEYAQKYNDRRDVNRDIAGARALFAQMPYEDGWPDEEVSVTDLVEGLSEWDCIDKANKKAVADNNALADEAGLVEKKIEELKEQLANLEARLAEIQDEMVAFEMPPVPKGNREDLLQAISDAEAHNINARKKDAQKKNAAHIDTLQEESDTLTARLRAIEAAKAERIAAAEFPVPGLSFDAAGLSLNGIPFSQCSHSEQLRVAISMAIASNPDLHIVLFRDGSAYDEDSWAMLHEMAVSRGFQVWAEVVGDSDKVTVLLEEGAVKAR